MPRHIYLCARFGRQAELRGHRETLQALGYHVASQWLDDQDNASEPNASVSRQCIALRLIEDVMPSDTVIVFTDTDGAPWSRGGRHCELITAVCMRRLATKALRRVVIIGPLENIFYALADEHYSTLLDAVAYWNSDTR